MHAQNLIKNYVCSHFPVILLAIINYVYFARLMISREKYKMMLSRNNYGLLSTSYRLLKYSRVDLTPSIIIDYLLSINTLLYMHSYFTRSYMAFDKKWRSN